MQASIGISDVDSEALTNGDAVDPVVVEEGAYLSSSLEAAGASAYVRARSSVPRTMHPHLLGHLSWLSPRARLCPSLVRLCVGSEQEKNVSEPKQQRRMD